MLGGAVVVVGHLTICDDVLVTFHSTVLRSIEEPGTYSGGLPADKAARWRRNAARFGRLGEPVQDRAAPEGDGPAAGSSAPSTENEDE
jgi:UDP-3-O-[3-hydroxymyristoyl] glucosamine N-acyltransferase